MASKQELKQRVNNVIDEKAEEIIRISKTILENPEPGYREEKTAKLVSEVFSQAGIQHRTGIAMTGLKGEFNGGNAGPTVGVIGELDSLVVSEHPHADGETSAAHACGHHCQIGMMLGAAFGLMDSGVRPHLSGRLALFAVPAEEFIEIEYRDDLRLSGKVEFLGGKPEFIRLGEFDDVDMALMCHTTSIGSEGKLCISDTNNGLVAKRIKFIGKGSHAGGAPHLGVNALNAASLALMAIHANRETFKDPDTIRVHPIITKGGEAVSAVPADVRMETFVRGANFDAILDASRKVDRALRAGAMAVGATVEITTIPSYMPLNQDPTMMDMFKGNAIELVGEEGIGYRKHSTGSTDMGDVSQLMPAIHPYVGGATGIGHGADYVVHDYGLAVVTAAKALANTVVDLLGEGGEGAADVLSKGRKFMTKNDYLKSLRSLAKEERFNPEP
ncbi:amidohydrolase [SAR202 cluster bacterium AD-804-J14_MRT_500m]|nr:amidohydrolase [SAR202 cluster bacterium AD-804-J14_MRT_500m]